MLREQWRLLAFAACIVSLLIGNAMAENRANLPSDRESRESKGSYRQLSDDELRSVLSNVGIRFAGGIDNGWTRIGDEGTEFFESNGSYKIVGRMLLRGSFRIDGGKVCITLSFRKITECRKVFKDASSDLYFAYDRSGFSFDKMVRFRTVPDNR